MTLYLMQNKPVRSTCIDLMHCLGITKYPEDLGQDGITSQLNKFDEEFEYFIMQNLPVEKRAGAWIVDVKTKMEFKT